MKRFATQSPSLVGILSDTHGRLPASVATAFKQVDLILHAGDIGKPEILASLEKIAPTIGVRGNMDQGIWARRLAAKEIISIGKTTLCLLHDIGDLESKANRYHAVISGHTHRPSVARHLGMLHINPGSAAQPRQGYPASVALLHIENGAIDVRLIELDRS